MEPALRPVWGRKTSKCRRTVSVCSPSIHHQSRFRPIGVAGGSAGTYQRSPSHKHCIWEGSPIHCNACFWTMEANPCTHGNTTHAPSTQNSAGCGVVNQLRTSSFPTTQEQQHCITVYCIVCQYHRRQSVPKDQVLDIKVWISSRPPVAAWACLYFWSL